MPTRRLAAWLLIPLLVLATSSGSICWCAHEGQGHCGRGGAEEPLASCHGGGAKGQSRAAVAGHTRRAPCSPAGKCRCLESGNPAAKAPEGPALGGHAAPALFAAPLATLVLDPVSIRAHGIPPGQPGDHSPPLFVVNCTFRC